MGKGIYFGSKEKAENFARNKKRHGGEKGGVLVCLIFFDYPKYQ